MTAMPMLTAARTATTLFDRGGTILDGAVLELIEHEHKQVRSLIAAVGCTSGGMTNTLNRLERSGFIRRERSEADRRATIVSITRVGQARLNEFRKHLDAAGLR